MTSGIQGDEAWKEQAQKEKERLGGGAKAEEKGEAGVATSEAASNEVSAKAGGEAKEGRKRPPLPPASFGLLLEELLTRAYLSLGLFPHPATGKVEKDLELARHSIDMLAVVQEKTKGNLSAGEEQAIASALYELRMTYVKVAGKG